MSDPTDEIAALKQRITGLEAEKANLTESARRATNLSVAYNNVRTERNGLEADLAESIAKNDDLQQQVEQLTDERNTAAAIAQQWYDWAHQTHPEHFDDKGNWLKKPRKSKPNKTTDNSVAPEPKSDDVTPDPAPSDNTSDVAPATPVHNPAQKPKIGFVGAVSNIRNKYKGEQK